MKKYSKTFNINKIKRNYPYYVSDITALLGVTKGTVYSWFEEGLQPIDDRPIYIIINGAVLRAFIKNRQENRKWKCKINEMPCFKCQRPRSTLEGKASVQTSKGRKPNLTGKCSVCNSQMNKAISLKNISEIAKTFELEKPHDLHLAECATTTCNHNPTRGE